MFRFFAVAIFLLLLPTMICGAQLTVTVISRSTWLPVEKAEVRIWIDEGRDDLIHSGKTNKDGKTVANVPINRKSFHILVQPEKGRALQPLSATYSAEETIRIILPKWQSTIEDE